MYRYLITLITGMLALTAGRLCAEIEPLWSTGVALPGEKVVLYLIDTDIENDLFLIHKKPKVEHAQVDLRQPQSGPNPLDQHRRNAEVYPIIITPDTQGTIRVKDLEVEYKNGRKVKVDVPELPVVPTSKVQWQTSPINYGVIWYPYVEKDGYVDQEVKVALKFMLPAGCMVPMPPQFHSVGVKTGTFHNPVEGVASLVHKSLFDNTVAYAKGNNWLTEDFVGSYTPFREGKSDIAGTAGIVQASGFFTSQAEAKLPIFTTSALPLPPGTPADYAHAVGSYRMQARTEAKDLAMNEAVEVEVTVYGTGNLEQLPAPQPEDADSWKLVPATRKPILSSNGETIGVTFTQLMRPTAEVGGIPAFHFSYFNPAELEYRQVISQPIALPWRETEASGSGMQATAAEPPPAGTVPVAEMTDIYGYVPSGSLWSAVYSLPRQLWLLLYLPALALLGTMAVRAMLRRFAAGSAQRALNRELDAIAARKDNLNFLKAVGGFIESRIDSAAMNPALQDILNRRDVEVYRPDAHTELTPADRSRMMKAVRKALAAAGTTAVLLLAALLPPCHAAESTDAAQEAYRANQYSKCMEILNNRVNSIEDAAQEYNLGNCHYRLKNPGEAAYHYARALQLNPSFAEARANLGFIQRKEGAILPLGSAPDEVFTFLSAGRLWIVTVICTAILAFCVALLIYRRSTPHKPWLNACTAVSAMLSLLCGADWVYYCTRETPDISYLPAADTAYVITTTTARSAADAEGSMVVTLPASTPVHLLAQRGEWSYVETFTGVRGWVAAKDVRALVPGSTPKTPVIIRWY